MSASRSVHTEPVTPKMFQVFYYSTYKHELELLTPKLLFQINIQSQKDTFYLAILIIKIYLVWSVIMELSLNGVAWEIFIFYSI